MTVLISWLFIIALFICILSLLSAWFEVMGWFEDDADDEYHRWSEYK